MLVQYPHHLEREQDGAAAQRHSTLCLQDATDQPQQHVQPDTTVTVQHASAQTPTVAQTLTVQHASAQTPTSAMNILATRVSSGPSSRSADDADDGSSLGVAGKAGLTETAACEQVYGLSSTPMQQHADHMAVRLRLATESTRLALEKQKVASERQGLIAENQRLMIENQRLMIENQRLLAKAEEERAANGWLRLQLEGERLAYERRKDMHEQDIKERTYYQKAAKAQTELTLQLQNMMEEMKKAASA